MALAKSSVDIKEIEKAPLFVTSIKSHSSTDSSPTVRSELPVSASPAPATRSLGLSFHLIVSAFLAGLAFAVGHIVFYSKLDGKATSSHQPSYMISQDVAISIGTAFACLVKTCCTTCIGVAFAQIAWWTSRRKDMSIEGLDALFSAPRSVLSFLSLDLWTTGGIAVFIALLSWCLPALTIAAPGSLTVHLQAQTHSFPCEVPALGMNTPGNWFIYSDKGYGGSTHKMRRIVSAVLAGGQYLQSPIPETCGPNCSYALEAYVPAWSCSLQEFEDWNDGFASPERRWKARTRGIAMSRPENGLTTVDDTFHTASYGRDLVAAAWSYDNDDYASSQNFSCLAYNSSFKFAVDFQNGFGTTKLSLLDKGQPFTSSEYNECFDGRANEVATTIPSICNTASYQAVFDAVYRLLDGSLTSNTNTLNLWSESAAGTPTLGVLESSLATFDITSVDDVRLNWVRNLPEALESLMQNITISMLSASAATQMTECTRDDLINVFKNKTWRLIAIYAPALLLTFLCGLFGIWTMLQNNFTADLGFKSFFLSTRDPSLSNMDVTREGWAKKTRLKAWRKDGRDFTMFYHAQ
ncbi:hypothetical protein BT69DRAFT_272649 [Atractiella rhizophila]|nr:hypothetical protein BT69DRAFT_272649 [Atractiella rhizophila]